jgi:hypothetical protein
LSTPDEGYSRLPNLLTLSTPDEGYSRLPNLLTLSTPDEGYSRLPNLLTQGQKIGKSNNLSLWEPVDKKA